jgi:hypothetical protein
MLPAKSALACGLAAVILGGCGVAAKPLAGTAYLRHQPGFFGKVVSQRAGRVACLAQHGFAVRQYFTSGAHLPAIQVGSLPSGPTLVFYPNPGAAEGVVIRGQAQGAEMIGPVLLYPHGASLQQAKVIEKCAAAGLA